MEKRMNLYQLYLMQPEKVVLEKLIIIFMPVALSSLNQQSSLSFPVYYPPTGLSKA